MLQTVSPTIVPNSSEYSFKVIASRTASVSLRPQFPLSVANRLGRYFLATRGDNAPAGTQS